MADGVSIRMQDLVRELKQTDKKFASSVRKQVRKAITEAGADITAQVRASASWSRNIPGATTMRPNFTAKSAGVRISVNRRKVPYAKAYELGNIGASPGLRTFKHPVFGRRRTRSFLFGAFKVSGRVLVKQDKKPFFFNSVEKRTPETERKFIDAIDQAVRDAGFH